MKVYGKKITLFLIDGVPDGRIWCELSNWTGKAYKIPRMLLSSSSDRKELHKPGVYLLLGKNEENRFQVYIGEAENIFNRLKQHLSEKDFWHEVICFISKDDNLNKAHIKYLERKLFDWAKEAKKYEIVNSSQPSKPKISEADRAEIEEFGEIIKLLTNTLGHKVFEKIINREKSQENYVFKISGARGTDAYGVPTSNGFVVFKGSKIAQEAVRSFPATSAKLRNTLIESGIISEQDNGLIFTQDYEFTSPSAAAAVVMGRSANGLIEWKLENGTTLKEFELKNKDTERLKDEIS